MLKDFTVEQIEKWGFGTVEEFFDTLVKSIDNVVKKRKPDPSYFREDINRVGEDECSEDDSYEAVRDSIFAMMLDDEVSAFDTLESFISAPKAGLPEDMDSLEARVEHASWNNDGLRAEMVHALAKFESAVAYYAALVRTGASEEEQDDVFEGVTDEIEHVCFLAKELELRVRVIVTEFEADRAGERLKKSIARRDELLKELRQMAAFREEMYGEDYSSGAFDEDDLDDDDGFDDYDYSVEDMKMFDDELDDDFDVKDSDEEEFFDDASEEKESTAETESVPESISEPESESPVTEKSDTVYYDEDDDDDDDDDDIDDEDDKR